MTIPSGISPARDRRLPKLTRSTPAEIAAYNKTLTALGENKNSKGDGWQPPAALNEYRLAEIFSNDTSNIRVQGCPAAPTWWWKPPPRRICIRQSRSLVVIDR